MKKCSLRGLENRPDFRFFTYPDDRLPDLTGYLMLAMDGPPLTLEDEAYGLLLIDSTWRYAPRMAKQISLPSRSLPPNWKTAYPRRQDDTRGLASLEAIFAAYTILQRDTSGLLDHYHWKDHFLTSVL